ALPSSVALTVLLTNLLLARQPLYAIPAWVARRVPEPLGLNPGQAALLNDDRIGRALDHLQRAARARPLTALAISAVPEVATNLPELHQDPTPSPSPAPTGSSPLPSRRFARHASHSATTKTTAPTSNNCCTTSRSRLTAPSRSTARFTTATPPMTRSI